MDDQELTGFWTPTDYGNQAYPGRLFITAEDRLRLELIGTPVMPNEPDMVKKHRPIHGQTTNGRLVTLFDAELSAFEMRVPGIPTCTFSSPLGYVGGHLAEDVPVDKLQLGLRYLTDWVGRSSIEEQFVEDGLDVRLRRRELSKAEFPGTTVTVVAGYATSGSTIRARTLQQIVRIEVEVEEPTTFSRVLNEWIVPLRDLLSLAVDRPSAIDGIRLRLLDPTESGERTWVDIHMPVTLPPDHHRRPPQPYGDMLFSHADIKDRLDVLVAGWLEVRAELAESCELYFATRYRDVYLSSEFLMLCQALEVWDRRVNGKVRGDLEAITRRVDEVLEATPKKHRGWLKSRLAHAGEPSLRDRMAGLAKEVEGLMRPILPEGESFPDLIADTRNYLTHYDDKLAAKAADGRQLVLLTRRMAVLAQGLMLSRMGLDEPTVLAIYRRHQGYVSLARASGAKHL